MPNTLEQPTAQADPIAAARDQVAKTRDTHVAAREALFEAVRQRSGNGGPRVIDDVASKTGIDPASVQRALWSLLAARELETDEAGNVVLPGHHSA